MIAAYQDREGCLSSSWVSLPGPPRTFATSATVAGLLDLLAKRLRAGTRRLAGQPQPAAGHRPVPHHPLTDGPDDPLVAATGVLATARRTASFTPIGRTAKIAS